MFDGPDTVERCWYWLSRLLLVLLLIWWPHSPTWLLMIDRLQPLLTVTGGFCLFIFPLYPQCGIDWLLTLLTRYCLIYRQTHCSVPLLPHPDHYLPGLTLMTVLFAMPRCLLWYCSPYWRTDDCQAAIDIPHHPFYYFPQYPTLTLPHCYYPILPLLLFPVRTIDVVPLIPHYSYTLLTIIWALPPPPIPNSSLFPGQDWW